MGNKFYDPGANRAAKVDALFSRIASRYDLINDLQSFGLHRRWKKRVLQIAGAGPAQKALDLCCGTGDLALGLAAAGSPTIGLDFNRDMLEIARRRTQGRAVELVRGDAQNLPFSDGSFDIVTVGYGLRNLSSWETGLSEMARVTRSGGRIVVLDFGKPDFGPWRFLYFAYLRFLVPVLGLVFCGDASAYAYILESLKHYPAQRGVAAKMRELGLREVRIVTFLGGVMSINVGVK